MPSRYRGLRPIADPAEVLNFGLRTPTHASFDLAMPQRAYSAVDLSFGAQDFLATAKVTGLRALDDPHPLYLGVFSLFDLTGQRLGRGTSLPLSESTFPFLHIDLTIHPAPGNTALTVGPAFVTAANIPPSRVAQTLYETVAATTDFVQHPRETVATFTIPAHVPVERVTFEIEPGDQTNFSRPVTLSATLIDPAPKRNRAVFPVEELSGQIARVHLTEAGQEIRQVSLSVPAIFGSNSRKPATIQVAIANGDDRPLKLAAVRLEMRQRKLCFGVPAEAASQAALQLVYGAPGTPLPVYDIGRFFNPASATRVARLGPEARNLHYKPRVIERPFNERYPELLWIALLSTISLLGSLRIAARRARRFAIDGSP